MHKIFKSVCLIIVVLTFLIAGMFEPTATVEVSSQVKSFASKST